MNPNDNEILNHINTVYTVVMNRSNASLLDLRNHLHKLDNLILGLPSGMDWSDKIHESPSMYEEFRKQISAQWPELGFYDPSTGLAISYAFISEAIGDAIDDLADVTGTLRSTLEELDLNPTGALHFLKFAYDTHLDTHINGLLKHLNAIIRQTPPF